MTQQQIENWSIGIKTAVAIGVFLIFQTAFVVGQFWALKGSVASIESNQADAKERADDRQADIQGQIEAVASMDRSRADGRRFKGRTAVQVTGRANYAAFRDWCRSIGLDAPDLAVMPEAILTDPWEGLAPIWYWVTHGLNSLADAGDLGGITKRINGGYNGLADRKRFYARAALVLLGFAVGDISGFQRAAGLAADGVAGPKTMAAFHAALLKRSAPVAAKPITPRYPPMIPPALETPERPGFWAALIAMLRR